MANKVTPGTHIRTNPMVSSAGTVNGVLDLLNRGKAQGFDHPQRGHKTKLSTDLVMVKNVSGSARDRGDCLQLGDYLLDDTDLHQLWFEGDTPVAPLWRCAILQKTALVDAIVPAHVQGVCVAKVSVQDMGDTHANPEDGSNVLHSSQAGIFELLSPASGLGTQLMAVRFASRSLERQRANVALNGTLSNVLLEQVGYLEVLTIHSHALLGPFSKASAVTGHGDTVTALKVGTSGVFQFIVHGSIKPDQPCMCFFRLKGAHEDGTFFNTSGGQNVGGDEITLINPSHGQSIEIEHEPKPFCFACHVDVQENDLLWVEVTKNPSDVQIFDGGSRGSVTAPHMTVTRV